MTKENTLIFLSTLFRSLRCNSITAPGNIHKHRNDFSVWQFAYKTYENFWTSQRIKENDNLGSFFLLLLCCCLGLTHLKWASGTISSCTLFIHKEKWKFWKDICIVNQNTLLKSMLSWHSACKYSFEIGSCKSLSHLVFMSALGLICTELSRTCSECWNKVCAF